jgi:hypothetical protein
MNETGFLDCRIDNMKELRGLNVIQNEKHGLTNI